MIDTAGKGNGKSHSVLSCACHCALVFSLLPFPPLLLLLQVFSVSHASCTHTYSFLSLRSHAAPGLRGALLGHAGVAVLALHHRLLLLSHTHAHTHTHHSLSRGRDGGSVVDCGGSVALLEDGSDCHHAKCEGVVWCLHLDDVLLGEVGGSSEGLSGNLGDVSPCVSLGNWCLLLLGGCRVDLLVDRLLAELALVLLGGTGDAHRGHVPSVGSVILHSQDWGGNLLTAPTQAGSHGGVVLGPSVGLNHYLVDLRELKLLPCVHRASTSIAEGKGLCSDVTPDVAQLHVSGGGCRVTTVLAGAATADIRNTSRTDNDVIGALLAAVETLGPECLLSLSGEVDVLHSGSDGKCTGRVGSLVVVVRISR
mmetsp:Transcript_12696/g.24738  ORF Transcript_12696/g.24738 Transcript_12696/m.24738 type:complete len:366 (+) Transcript_12696:837-1934(+)